MTQKLMFVSARLIGPLGIVYLPHYWWKAFNEAFGTSDSDAFEVDVDRHIDAIIEQGTGLDRKDVLECLREEYLSYRQFESWLKSLLYARVSSNSIEWINKNVLGFEYDELTRSRIARSCGISEQEAASLQAIELNDLYYKHALRQDVAIEANREIVFAA